MLGRIRGLKEDQGFTLIELLIVIIILGILAAIVIFGVSTFRRDAAQRACETDVKQVKVAVQAYRAKYGSFPTTQGQVVPAYLETWPGGGSTGYTIGHTGGVVTPSPACDAVT